MSAPDRSFNRDARKAGINSSQPDFSEQEGGKTTVTAIVALKVDRKKVNDIASHLSGMKDLTEVYSVSGRYDLIAIVRTRDNEALSDIVTGAMLKLDGIVDSETMLAFRAYSKHDL